MKTLYNEQVLDSSSRNHLDFGLSVQYTAGMNTETVDDVLALAAQFLVIKAIADGRTACYSKGGRDEGMDNNSELSNYRQIIDKLDVVLSRTSNVHRWKFRG